MSTSPARPSTATCPGWCDSAREDRHWVKLSDLMPWETIHTRRFGDIVTVHAGHEVHDDDLETWATPSIALTPYRVELIDGPSQLWIHEAAALAGHLQAAAAFALALEATTARA
ncbi:hypothetical protein M4D54_09225 [Brachybacterium sp. p3-SID1565]|nr:hypothetical protein [Brachybacterium sp. p3-SID1565]MCT1385804.1 hypothetical protein [Brachybacterium sp. p3-SID1565]